MTNFNHCPRGGQLPDQAPKPDPYEVLGVPRLASVEYIKKVFRAQAKLYHTDRRKINPESVDPKRFDDARKAWEAILLARSAQLDLVPTHLYSQGVTVEPSTLLNKRFVHPSLC